MFKAYKEHLQLNDITTGDPIGRRQKIWTPPQKRHTDGTQAVRRCSALYVGRGLQVSTTPRCHHARTQTPRSRTLTSPRAGEDGPPREPSSIAGGTPRGAATLEATVLPTELTSLPTFAPATARLNFLPELEGVSARRPARGRVRQPHPRSTKLGSNRSTITCGLSRQQSTILHSENEPPTPEKQGGTSSASTLCERPTWKATRRTIPAL